MLSQNEQECYPVTVWVGILLVIQRMSFKKSYSFFNTAQI
jgi:hypothetical protein